MGLLTAPIRRVACAISGGVDSAVSAYLIKRKGFDVVGVFMTNWDQQDEKIKCSIDEDREDARFVCRKLGIELVELNFVKDYWNDVFTKTTESYAAGKTPNPDILCNRYVKFQKLTEVALESSPKCHPFIRADALATGHYAQNSYGNFLENRDKYDSPPKLLRSVDLAKDQTFWLCNISWRHLQHCMFPVGNLLKSDVKKIAASVGLERIAKRKESMGICFIGKRNFSEFIDKYLEPRKGLIVELETGQVFGEHSGVHHFTIGQKVPVITHGNKPFYIAKLDPHSQEIFVVQGSYHPALYMEKCWTEKPSWISEESPTFPSSEYAFQWQNKWRPVSCRMENSGKADSGLYIELEKPMRCIAPGQFAAFYEDNVCLGGAIIDKSKSLFDDGKLEPYTEWSLSDNEIQMSKDS